MRRLREDDWMQLGTGFLGLTLLVSAGLSADLARAHMAALGRVCGADPPHCGWCYAAVAFALAGLSAFAAAFRPLARPQARRRS